MPAEGGFPHACAGLALMMLWNGNAASGSVHAAMYTILKSARPECTTHISLCKCQRLPAGLAHNVVLQRASRADIERLTRGTNEFCGTLITCMGRQTSTPANAGLIVGKSAACEHSSVQLDVPRSGSTTNLQSQDGGAQGGHMTRLQCAHPKLLRPHAMQLDRHVCANS